MRSLIFHFFIILCLFAPYNQSTAQDNDDALHHAKELLSSSILLDGHNDLVWTIRKKSGAPGDIAAYDLNLQTHTDTDMPRLKHGHVGGQFWSVYIPAEPKSGHARAQLEQIDLARQLIKSYSKDLTLTLNSTEIEQAFAQGHIASLLGMEGGQGIENSLGALRAFYTLGVRYMTLTHSKTLDWVDSATDTARHNGMTPFGEEVVREMNRLGMLVDLSHTSDMTMSDVLDISQAPVIFSHSSARALTNHERNVPDSILTRLTENGGVCMVTFIPVFVSQQLLDWERSITKRRATLTDKEYDEYIKSHPKPQATLKQVADHIEHVVKISGIDHVGIGSDYYGSGKMPVGLEDVSKFPNLFAELIRRGWSDADLRKLAGENIMRVIKTAENTAQRLQKERPASHRSIDD